MDQPVKTYSTGMAMRLAFAVAIHVDPDTLIIDEAIAVGDVYFRQRCMRKIHQIRDLGRPYCSSRTRRQTSRRSAIDAYGWIGDAWPVWAMWIRCWRVIWPSRR